MGTTNVTWVQDTQFIGTDSTGHSVVISSPTDGIGMKPSDLILVSLGSCTAYDIVTILSKQRIELNVLQVTVSGEQDSDPPWAYNHIHVHYRVGGAGLTAAKLEKAIHLSEEKYCSVSATLSKAVEITFDYELVEVSEPAPS